MKYGRKPGPAWFLPDYRESRTKTIRAKVAKSKEKKVAREDYECKSI